MSRTDKTKPFWVKLAHGDLHSVEQHDHTDGRCDLPPITDAVAFTYGTTQCRRDFHYTGIRTCCCPLCHGGHWRRERRKQRHAGRRAARNWERDYDESWDDGDLWVDNGGYAGSWNVTSWWDEVVEDRDDDERWFRRGIPA